MISRKFLVMSLCCLAIATTSGSANAQTAIVTFDQNSKVTVTAQGNSTNSIVQLVPGSAPPIVAPNINVTNKIYSWQLQSDNSYKATMFGVSTNNQSPSSAFMDCNYTATAKFIVTAPSGYSSCVVNFQIKHNAMATASTDLYGTSGGTAFASIDSSYSYAGGLPMDRRVFSGYAPQYYREENSLSNVSVVVPLTQVGNQSVGEVPFTFTGVVRTSTSGSVSTSAHAQAGSWESIKFIGVTL